MCYLCIFFLPFLGPNDPFQIFLPYIMPNGTYERIKQICDTLPLRKEANIYVSRKLIAPYAFSSFKHQCHASQSGSLLQYQCNHEISYHITQNIPSSYGRHFKMGSDLMSMCQTFCESPCARQKVIGPFNMT